MPKMVTEIAQGQNFEYTKEENRPSVTSARVFRIIKNDPSELLSLTDVCGVKIGDKHPRNPDISCYHYTGVYDGESRLVILATFDYRLAPASSNGENPDNSPPDLRPAMISTSTSLIEAPAYMWEESQLDNAGGFAPLAAPQFIENPVGDPYEGVTRLVPITTITIEQWEEINPFKNIEYAGDTNRQEIPLLNLTIRRRCLMFRGVSAKAAVESWGNAVYHGWQCTYEFLYKKNPVKVKDENGVLREFDLGWDVLQPVTGFSCKAFAPPGNASQDVYGQPLKWNDNGEVVSPIALPTGIAAGEKVRSHVRVGVRGGKDGQRPSAQPIPLNADGTPRKETADPKVLVKRYRVTNEFDWADLKIRLE